MTRNATTTRSRIGAQSISRKVKSPFFILGNPRSGTTLLRLMLTSHPRLLVPPECGFAVWWSEKYGDWCADDAESPARVDAVVGDILSSRKMETWGLDAAELNRRILQCRPASYPQLVTLVYETYGALVGKSDARWGDKNNFYIGHIPDLLKMFPDAQFIHIVRDGRDVACSYRELNRKLIDSAYAPKLPDAIEDIAASWRQNTLQVSGNLSTVDGTQGCQVRFEDLIRDAESELKRICEFLGEEFDSAMLDYHQANTERKLEPVEFLQWKEKTLAPPSESAIGRYKRDLSPEDVALFEESAGEALRRFGYA